MFCKNGLDEGNTEGVLGIQVIGRTIKFYLLALPATGLYIMRELATVQVPSSLNDLSKLVLDMPSVLLVLDVFARICVPPISSQCPNRHTPKTNASMVQPDYNVHEPYFVANLNVESPLRIIHIGV
ncbi:hypothetical protein [Absidia glauca]|uniref:Uncharacterized protein n=1 Tax=Absidia glauca TaxID=4829 RepID=A0A168MES8_ABSGL|nr:hypothetical protein [Absidia glauca]